MERRTISRETFEKVIRIIPQDIIRMLPDIPENLLKYATRKKKMYVSAGIKEDIKNLMQSHLLNDEEYLRTFFYVMAITFINKRVVEYPEIAIVVAQTGSGKSNLTAKILNKDSNYIFIDSDKYKHFRFDAQRISNQYPLLYPYLTGPDGYDHAENIYAYAIDKKYNIIKETAPSLKNGLIGFDEKELQRKNYKISMYILAVGELNSLLSMHERYELQIIHGLKTAKLTGIMRHDESYDALIENINNIERDKNISYIGIYVRGTKQGNFNPTQIYPSDNYKTPIEAITEARKLDNNRTVLEFQKRYELIISQMNNRKAPKAQFEQLEEIKKRWELLKKVGG